MKTSVGKLAAVVLLVGLVSACANTDSLYQSKNLPADNSSRTVVLMPPDMELSEMQAGGVLEPKAEWTDTARKLSADAIAAKLQAQNTRLVVANPDLILTDPGNPELALIKLHDAVGMAIRLHRLSAVAKLPSKAGQFDWTLGPDVKILHDRYNADYALFVQMRDSYASAGRVATMVVAAAFGVGIQGGSQSGFATLVDLRTGDVLWINTMIRTVGDLRQPDGAASTMDILLKNFPK